MTTERESLTGYVHTVLRERIFAGDLEPGTALSVPALAAELNVSRTPVREAVQLLAYEGIATYTPNAGAKVSTLDADTVQGVFEVREVLDGLAAFHGARRAGLADLITLRAMVAEQHSVLTSPVDSQRDATLDLEFHGHIRVLAGNRPLSDALARLDAQAHLFRVDLWTSDLNRRLAVSEHERILAAIEAGDADGARVAAGAHVAALLVRAGRV